MNVKGRLARILLIFSARDVKTTIEIHLGVPSIANATLIPN